MTIKNLQAAIQMQVVSGKEGHSICAFTLGIGSESEFSCRWKLIKIFYPTRRWNMNQDPMATQQLASGVRQFANDIDKVEEIVRAKIAAIDVKC